MGATYFFLEALSDRPAVIDWFKNSASIAAQSEHDRGLVIQIGEVGDLSLNTDGSIDPARSPVVNVLPPRLALGSLLTLGEVHFLTVSRLIPGMDTLARRFGRWLENEAGTERIDTATDPRSYYMEGTIQNLASKIYAFPSGLAELESRRYFLSDDDALRDQTKLCKRLRLRGVECG